MFESLALKIAHSLKKVEPEKTASVEVMKFALEAILNTTFTVILITVVGLATGTFLETVTGFVAFALLRFFSGGLHLKSALHCSILSTIMITIAPHIPINIMWIQIIGIICVLLMLVFAPSNIEGHARIPKKYFFVLKLVSAGIVASNFYFLDHTICMVFAFQAATIVEFRRR